jgi:hypothetical protein
MINNEQQQSKDDMMRDYEKFIKLAEDKTVITLLEKLVNSDDNLLEFITEYPSVVYTKEMVKLMTYVKQYMQTYNIIADKNGQFDKQDVEVIEEMCRQFMLKMTSHKRRRSTEIVNGASRQEAGTQVITEHKGLKKFLGIK